MSEVDKICPSIMKDKLLFILDNHGMAADALAHYITQA